MKKIIAIPGSLRAGSSNHAILKYLEGITPAGIEFILYEGLGTLPHFDPGLDGESLPVVVGAFRSLLAAADGVIICTPEYAFGVPGSLKNVLDWTVGAGSLEDKPLLLITASTGGQHAHAALQLILKNALGAKLSDDTSLLIPFIRTKLDSAGAVADVNIKEKLTNCLENLSALI